MPKGSSYKPRGPRPQSSTDERRARALRIREAALEMVFRCKRCEEKSLRCFVDTATGRCAGCISVHAECSLFVPEEEWEKVEQEKQDKRLALLRAEATVAQSQAEAARLRAELAEVEDRERQFARRDLAVLDVQNQTQESGGSSTVATLSVVPTFADFGWSQAKTPPPDPLLDQFLDNFFPEGSFPDFNLSLPLGSCDDTAPVVDGSS